MAYNVRGLFEVSLRDAAKALAEHAYNQRLKTTPASMLAILCNEIMEGKLKPTLLVRSSRGAIDGDKTLVETFAFTDQEYLVSIGVHSPSELGSNEFPDFGIVEHDAYIVAFIESTLHELRAAIADFKDDHDPFVHPDVMTLVAALGASNREVREKLVERWQNLPPPTNWESREQRRGRLSTEVRSERGAGNRAFLQTVAKREGISVQRLKQLLGDAPSKS